jgi:hypothetical protein
MTLIRKFSILVLALFVVGVFAVKGYTQGNIFPLENGQVYKVKRAKIKCWDNEGKKQKVKPVKKLHMRVFEEPSVGTTGSPDFEPGFAKTIFYTSSKKAGTTVVGWGEITAEWPENFIIRDGMVERFCGTPTLPCEQVDGDLMDGFVIMSSDRPEPESLMTSSWDRKRPSLKCDFTWQGFAKIKRKKTIIDGWSTGYCWDTVNTVILDDGTEVDKPLRDAMKCEGKWKMKTIK